MSEITQPIPARLKNVAVNGHVAGAADIIDDNLNKDQETINSELVQAVGTGGSVDERIAAAVAPKANSADVYTKSETYTKTEVNGLVDTPHQNYVTVATYASLPVTGSADTIYRVSNYNGSTSQVDASVYSEYAWNGSQYVFLCVKSQIGEVFDISVYNNNTKYADLTAALGTNGANVPQELRKGGMSVKFVQSSDNNYVKFFCTADEFTTDVTKWQGVDDEPTAESENLVKSGGVLVQINNKTRIYDYESVPVALGMNASAWSTGTGLMINIAGAKDIFIKAKASINAVYAFLTSNDTSNAPAFVTGETKSLYVSGNNEALITMVPSDAVYLFVTTSDDRTPEKIAIDGVPVIGTIGSYTKDTGKRINDIDNILEDLKRKCEVFYDKNVNVAIHFNQSVWSDGLGVFYNVEGKDTVYLHSNADSVCPYAFLTSDDISNAPAFVSGMSQAEYLSANSERTISVPEDAKYFFVTLYSTSMNRTPTSIKIDNEDVSKSAKEDIYEKLEELEESIGVTELPIIATTKEYLGKLNGSIYEETATNRWWLNSYDISGLSGKVSGTSTSATGTAPWALYKNGVCIKFGAEGDVNFDENLDGTTYDTLYVQLRYPNMETKVMFKEFDSTVAELLQIVNNIKDNHPKPKISLPSKLYAVVGTEFNLYYDAFMTCVDREYSSYSVNILCDIGKAFQHGYQITPLAEHVGTHTMTIMVFNNNHEKIIEKTVSLIVLAKTGLNSTKNILMIGDSTLDNPYVTPAVYADFNGLGGIMPQFVGQKGTAPYKNCGMSGRGFNSFAREGYTYYRFDVTGVGTLAIGARYSDGTSQYDIVEINVTDGVGYINTDLKSGTGERTTSGTLTKVSGQGDSIITYDGISESQSNPFWNPNTNQLDIAMYKTNIGLSGDFDLVAIRLGINDMFGNVIKNPATPIASAKTLIDAFLAEYADTKIVIELTTICCNTRDGEAASYGATQSWDIFQYNIVRLIDALIEEFDNGAYNENVTVCATGMGVDRYYGYPFANVDPQVAARLPFTTKRHSNMVHPSEYGYYQIADFEFAHYLHELS